ncbi:catalase [Colletotrichum orchidophilum]|uniref:Catalase n=1 Tax=Colletotrichum orchidophilum TaxID=1209926 RepID=A0A1G4AUR1_9PEZI|nr:catalase [Colletotrichum orchidophilum]OHE92910.1 catalase [Colletotrichum orchidophilum]
MDIYRLSQDGRGLLGQLSLPGVLEARVILTGSRKVLIDLISQLEGSDAGEEVSENTDVDADSVPKHVVSADETKLDERLGSSEDQTNKEEPEESEEESDVEEQQRIKNFEKNSFRSPKFWFQWNGDVVSSTAPSIEQEKALPTSRETGRGYIVFSGNDCRSFKGTISCDSLGWKDVSLSGWKEVSMSERDVAFVWK